MLFSTILYKYTLRAWFQADDFAWLGLRLQIRNWHDLWHVMFAPMAQSSIRPLSERAFFLVFYSLFGINALPYRIAVYATQLAVVVMFAIVAQRFLKSYAAAFVAPVLWIANSALAQPLTWTCAYNEILCSGFFLLAFYGLVRYVQSGRRRFNVLQWITFLIGFGVLEINVMYPLIALLYTACFAPRFVKRTALLLIPSALFSIVFFAVRIRPRNEAFYALGAGVSTIQTLASYWSIALGPGAAARYFAMAGAMQLALTLILWMAVLWLVIWRSRRGDRIPIFCLGWFLITLAPFLPIYSHVTDYYVTVPCIGLALLGGWAVRLANEGGRAYRVAALVSIALYLAIQVPTARAESMELWARSVPLKRMVLGVRDVYRSDPKKWILLDGVNENAFWLGVYNRPFRLFGANNVYLTPVTARKIKPYPELGDISDFTIQETEMQTALSHNLAVVYAVHDDGSLQNVTKLFADTTQEPGLPTHIDVAHPLLESMLGPSWYASEGNFRWMPKDAAVRLGVTANGAGEVRVQAFCAPAQIAAKPLLVWLSVDGTAGPPVAVRDCGQPVIVGAAFHIAPGKREVEVGIHVDHTVRVGADLRDLGLAVQRVDIVEP